MQDFVACKVMVLPIAEPKPFLLKIKKNVLVMKITAVLLLATLQVAAKGWGQDQISLSFSNAPLEQVFSAITAQTSIAFLYRPEYVKDKKVTVKITNASLKAVLDICLKDQKLVYQIVGKTVAIHPAHKVNSVSGTEGITNTPPVDIKGRIVDSKGEAIPNATVSVKGSVKNTITNANGEFTLSDVEENAVLIISHVQYELESVVLKGNKSITIALQIKVNSLDEMQVIAYGTTTKRFNTGNIASVKADEIAKQPVNNPLLALQGRVPGLFITQSTGLPGTGVTVRIQGRNSITRGIDPLYIIDGVPFTSQLLPTLSNVLGVSGGIGVDGVSAGGGNPLSFINPADIESIEVLKDADATAIYGSKAANGAILIITKKGKAGKTKVDLNIQQGFGEVSNFLPLLNTEQYLEMRKEAKRNDNASVLSTDYDINGFWDTTSYTDWQKELIGGTARYTDAQAGISGGNANTQFLFSAGYHRETTVFPGDFTDEKGSLHFNINNVSNNQKFRFQFSGNYLKDNNQITTTDLTSQVFLAPTAPSLYSSNGTLNWATLPSGSSTWTNPLAFLLTKYRIESTNAVGNMQLSYEIINGLQLKSSFGYTSLITKEISPSPLDRFAPELRANNPRRTSFVTSNINSWIIEPQLSFTRGISKGKMDILIGATLLKTNSNRQGVAATGFNSDLVLEDIRSASMLAALTSIDLKSRYNALFGRINYNWKEKYILNFTARRDGSSRFGPESQFHNFASVGAAWIFSNEKFVKNNLPFLSFGKLRGSFGTTGNDQIGDYQFMNLYTAPSNVGVAYQNATGLLPNRLTNPLLQWEETEKLQFGIELGGMNNRLLLTVNAFKNKSSNLLLNYQLPAITGFFSQTRNFPATVQNSGWEFSLTANSIQTKNFSWATNFNLTIPKNELVGFPGLESSTYATSLLIGEPISIVKAYHFLGVNTSTGVYQFQDRQGNATSTPSFSTDATTIIDFLPKLYGGLQNNFSYKGIELDVLFQFVQQQGLNSYFGNNPGMRGINQPTWILDRWQKTGDDKLYQKFSSNGSVSDQFANANGSDKGLGDASYVRLKNASLSWKIPDAWMKRAKLQNAKLFVRGQNLITITNYKGLDPETLSNSALPPLRVVTFGTQLTF